METLSFLDQLDSHSYEYSVVKSRASLVFRSLRIKVVKWPYFVMEIDHPNILN